MKYEIEQVVVTARSDKDWGKPGSLIIEEDWWWVTAAGDKHAHVKRLELLTRTGVNWWDCRIMIKIRHRTGSRKRWTNQEYRTRWIKDEKTRTMETWDKLQIMKIQDTGKTEHKTKIKASNFQGCKTRTILMQVVKVHNKSHCDRHLIPAEWKQAVTVM